MEDLSTGASFISFSTSISLPSKLGWLKKKSPSLFRRWQKRFVVLINKKLYYYLDNNCNKKLGVLSFDHMSVDIQLQPPSDPRILTLSVLGHSRKFRFKAKNTNEAAEWALVLHRHVQESTGRHNDIIRPSVEGKFWKFDSISNSEFLEMATTGDIVLFRTKALRAAIQRCVTRSCYDHVGIILRSQEGHIALLQATGADGVAITAYDDLFASGDIFNFDRVAYRHLEVDRDEDFIVKLKDFLDKCVGKKYKLSPQKLLRRKSVVPGEEEHFFCSELVASAYIKLGLLSPLVSASRFWPGDFCESNKLNLTRGYIMPEMNIDFNLQ